MDAEQYAALTDEDHEWLRAMGWKPRFEWLRHGGELGFVFLPSITSMVPTVAELQDGIS